MVVVVSPQHASEAAWLLRHGLLDAPPPSCVYEGVDDMDIDIDIDGGGGGGERRDNGEGDAGRGRRGNGGGNGGHGGGGGTAAAGNGGGGAGGAGGSPPEQLTGRQVRNDSVSQLRIGCLTI